MCCFPDSLCTTLCLQWEPQAIAVAFLYLAGKLTKFDLQGLSQSKSRSWWRQFVDTLDFHDLECKGQIKGIFYLLSKLSVKFEVCVGAPFLLSSHGKRKKMLSMPCFPFLHAAICHQVLDIYGERDSEQKKSDSVST